MSIFQELKRRNVFRVAFAYLITAWLVMQVGDTMGPALHLPDWANSLLAFFLILGFPIAMFFAWVFELTPDGLKREQDVSPKNPGRDLAARKLNRAIVIVMALALGYFALDKFVFRASPPTQITSTTTEPGVSELASTVKITDKSIAVLPFVNMSSDPEQEYFSDGLTEELLNLLAGIKELKVAARTSSFYYKDKLESIPLTEIAQQLEVAHVLEGSVRKSGNTIRITAQLIKADDGFHLWSQTYDRNLDDIFAIQDEIAAAVTESLKITLLGAPPQSKVLNTESYELTMQGRYLFNRRNQGDLELALEKFQRATELDPENAAAWVGLAPLYTWVLDPPDIASSLAAAKKAVALAPENPEAHYRYFNALWRSGESDTLIEKHWNLAISLGQKNTLMLSVIAGIHFRNGNIEKAIEFGKRTVALDPLNITNLGNLSSNLINDGQLDLAEELSLRMLQLSPGNPFGLQGLANISLIRGNLKQSLIFLDQIEAGIQQMSEGDRTLQYQAMIYHSQGHIDAANNALETYIAKYSDEENFDIAQIYAWRGELDKAFEWLEHSLELAPHLLLSLKYRSFFENLHKDPRWTELMARPLPPIWEI